MHDGLLVLRLNDDSLLNLFKKVGALTINICSLAIEPFPSFHHHPNVYDYICFTDELDDPCAGRIYERMFVRKYCKLGDDLPNWLKH